MLGTGVTLRKVADAAQAESRKSALFWAPKNDFIALKNLIFGSWINLLLFLCPLGVWAHMQEWSPTAVFMLVRPPMPLISSGMLISSQSWSESLLLSRVAPLGQVLTSASDHVHGPISIHADSSLPTHGTLAAGVHHGQLDDAIRLSAVSLPGWPVLPFSTTYHPIPCATAAVPARQACQAISTC